jgi:hypothetical protein
MHSGQPEDRSCILRMYVRPGNLSGAILARQCAVDSKYDDRGSFILTQIRGILSSPVRWVSPRLVPKVAFRSRSTFCIAPVRSPVTLKSNPISKPRIPQPKPGHSPLYPAEAGTRQSPGNRR